MTARFARLTSASRRRTFALALAAAGACFAVGASDARAGERRGRDEERVVFNFDWGVRYDEVTEAPRRHRAPAHEVREHRVWCEPVYRTVCEKVWIEPVYRTVCDRVYVQPVVRRVCDKVWVPDRWEERTIVRRDRHGRTFRACERVLVERGHYDTIEREVVVSPGRWEAVEHQELVREGYFRTVERKELVKAGCWETRSERVALGRGGHEHHHHDYEDRYARFESRGRR